MKKHRLLALLINNFPLVKAYRFRRRMRAKKLKIRQIKDEPIKLRRYLIMSGTIRRL